MVREMEVSEHFDEAVQEECLCVSGFGCGVTKRDGYYTPFVAPKGKDGGIDLIAYQDPLGARLRHKSGHK